jgi:malonyl-CoA O-methyltransferase
MHDLGDALMHSGLEHPVMEMEYFVLTYSNVLALMRDLKHLGANNVSLGRRRTLTGKGRLNAMIAEYEKNRHAGKLPASYEVIYGHAWKPARPPTPAGAAGLVKVPVASIKRRKP